jgi:hypothetical protein
MSTPGLQLGRICQLLVSKSPLGGDTTGRDLSQLQFSFSVRAADTETPNTMVVRIYNLSPQTETEIVQQYTEVALLAGYQGTGLSVIFTGSIKMFRKGKENATDKFLEISASDGDLGYSYGFLNSTLGTGASQVNALQAAAQAMQTTLTQTANSTVGTGGIVFPRGKVLFGLARVHMRTIADTIKARWSIQNGAVTVIPVTSYLPGTVVKLNSGTGMINIPESTPNGIEVDCLLNPLLQIGGQVEIDSNDIVAMLNTQAGEQAGEGINFPSYTSHIFPATIQPGQGIYRIIVAEHQGDTRGNDWTTHLTCLAIDPSSPLGTSVSASG